ncbi:hypothetical protein CRENBAI_006589 [Crenichthys baileyi]|uniref:Uncharacterized protein n=1 Tax=Crenichthys baileyi TaxID=28760 RepID=A0AAV9R0Y1_9TELE
MGSLASSPSSLPGARGPRNDVLEQAVERFTPVQHNCGATLGLNVGNTVTGLHAAVPPLPPIPGRVKIMDINNQHIAGILQMLPEFLPGSAPSLIAYLCILSELTGASAVVPLG